MAILGSNNSNSGAGVAGLNQNPAEPSIPGYYANGAGAGVYGEAGNGTGVLGRSQTGNGVLGVAPGEAPAITALSSGDVPGPSMLSDGGLALNVVGKARFSTAGAAAIPRWRRLAFVPNPAVTANSHITVTLTGNPGLASISWVERRPGTGFIVHVSGWSIWDVPFTYLIVEPAT